MLVQSHPLPPLVFQDTSTAAPPASWTFHILTFGCKVNQYESQSIAEAWRSLGGVESATPEEAHVALVNSCAVTARGERDARNALYRLQRAAPGARRMLTGCSACLAAQGLDRPCVDVVIPPRSKALLLQGPWQWLLTTPHNHAFMLPPHVSSPSFGLQGFSIHAFRRARPVLKIQDGCSHRCTYCIVPLMRGPSQSRPADAILAEARLLLEAGHGEIMISGINLHHYGRNAQENDGICKDFWELLLWLDKELSPEWAGHARLRISSLEPTQLNQRGLDVLSQCRMLCPHAHLSLQNGSPKVLRRMGRGHCRPKVLLQAVQKLRSLWPQMGLGADILMGFPGENEDDVALTLEVIHELSLSYAHVFPYSQRPGTPAATFAEQVPHALKIERASKVRKHIEVQRKLFYQALAQKETLRIVLDRHDGHKTQEEKEDKATSPGTYKGIDAHYAACLLLHEGPPPPSGILTVHPVGVEEGAIVVKMPMVDQQP